MRPWELYHKIWHTEYRKSAHDLDWQIDVDRERRTIRLLFQASQSGIDWAVNFLGALPSPAYPYLFALGWHRVLRAGWKDISSALADAVAANGCFEGGRFRWRLVVCGHSYGGAVAVIAGVYIRRRWGIRPELVTYGAPKALCLLTSKLLAKGCFCRVAQYAHRSDLIPHMAPLPGFWHVRRVMLGKFSLRGLLDVQKHHYFSYFEPETFAGHEEDDV